MKIVLSGEEESSRFKGSVRNPRSLRTLAQRGRCEAALRRKAQGACAANDEQSRSKLRGLPNPRAHGLRLSSVRRAFGGCLGIERR